MNSSVERGSAEVTALLHAWSGGANGALDQLMPELYGELRRLATFLMARERSDHTLQPTALVHETFLRLRDHRSVQWQDREHFLAVATTHMRRLLLHHARSRRAAKRSPGGALLPLDTRVHPWVTTARATAPEHGSALTDLLAALHRLDPRQARIVALRVFGGLSEREVATWIGVSRATVQREWRLGKAWLRRGLQEGAVGDQRAAESRMEPN